MFASREHSVLRSEGPEMDLNRVAIFVRVVDEAGFTAAAKVLGLPKSSVSRAVALLEQELGARLLRRSTRHVTLTEAGAAFYERVSRGLAAFAEGREAVVDLEASVRGRVRVATAVDIGAALLAPLVAEFVARYPEVQVDVVLSARVADLVEEGFDLALRAGPLRDGSLAARKLAPICAALFAAPRYVEAHSAPRRVSELAQHRCVLFRAARGRATWTLKGRRGREETVEVTGPVSADDYGFVVQAVRAGAGIGFLPSFVTAVAGPEFTRVLAGYEGESAPLHLVYPADRYLPHRVAVFRDFVVDALGGKPPLPRTAAPRA